MQQCPQIDMYKRIKTALIPVVGRGKIFCAPDQIGKTKLAEAWYQDLLKFSKHF